MGGFKIGCATQIGTRNYCMWKRYGCIEYIFRIEWYDDTNQTICKGEVHLWKKNKYKNYWMNICY